MVAVSAENNDTSGDNKNEGSIPIKPLQQEIGHTTIVYNNNGTVNGHSDTPINITAEIKYHREGYNYNITEPVMSGTLRTVIDGQVFESQIINGTSSFLYTPTKSGTFTVTGTTSPFFDNREWLSNATLVIKEHGTIINGVSNKTNVTTGDRIKVTGNLTDDEGNIMPNTPITIIINNWIYEMTTDNNGNFYLEHVIGRFPGIVDVFVMFYGNSTHHSALLEIPLFVNNNTGNNSTKNNKTKENKNSNITKEIKTNKPIEEQEIIFKEENDSNLIQTKAAMKKTGIPIFGLLLVLILGALGIYRKR